MLSHPGTDAEAAEVQSQVAQRVELRPLPDAVGAVAGAVMQTVAGRSRAAAAVLSLPDLAVIDRATCPVGDEVEYRSGFRAFFEGRALAAALSRLEPRPDVVLFRGHGICHPRRCGLASHLGVVLGLPTIGCGGSLLWGQARTPGPARGDWTRILGEGGEVLGAALRTQANAGPVYVSPGHLCDVESAVGLVLACSPQYRWPEPLRAARRRETP